MIDRQIDKYLTDALVKESSDLHFISGDPPRVRVHGSLSTLSEEILTIDHVRDCMYEIMSGTTQKDFERDDAVDFACLQLDGHGRKAVFEILVNNRAISKLIMNDQSHQIPAQLQTGKDVGMQLMDMALLEAIEAKQVDPDDAFRFANDKRKFQRFVTDTSLVPILEGDSNDSSVNLETDGTIVR